jgi:hypothetical protein
MPVNICPTEKRAFVIIPRKFKYIIAEILVKKNVRGGNFREKMDCRVASLLAMTEREMDSRLRGNDI